MIMAMMLATSGMSFTRDEVRQSIARVDAQGLQHRRNLFDKKLIRYVNCTLLKRRIIILQLNYFLLYYLSFDFSRRVYNVAGPHHLWHMDGHHKLIRYGLITHGCIDGNTRTIIYLGFKDSNKSSVVLELFKDGVKEFQLPSRVRGDKGGNMQHIIIISKLS